MVGFVLFFFVVCLFCVWFDFVLGGFELGYLYFYKCRWGSCLDVRECVSVSAENLEKSLRQMERQLQQLERDLETFASLDDPNDMFLTKMAISFTHACIWLQVLWGIDLRG